MTSWGVTLETTTAAKGLMHGLSLALRKNLMTTIVSLVSEINLTVAREPGLAHPYATRGCQKRQSRRDWCESPARPAPAPLPRQQEFGVPRQLVVDRGPATLYPQMRLAQMQGFQGDGNVTLDMFSD